MDLFFLVVCIGIMLLPFLHSCFLWGKSDVVEVDTSSEEVLSDDMLPEVDAVLTSFGVVNCEEPELREEEPMIEVSLGPDWDNQPVEGYSPPEGFWFGGEGVAVEDFNQDNLLDVFIPTLDRNLLFIQQSDGSFEDHSETLLPFAIPTMTVGASVVDYDGDDDLDIFVLNLVDPNQLLENTGDGYFVDKSLELGIDQSS